MLCQIGLAVFLANTLADSAHESLPDDILLPDDHAVLTSVSEMVYNDAPWMEDVSMSLEHRLNRSRYIMYTPIAGVYEILSASESSDMV